MVTAALPGLLLAVVCSFTQYTARGIASITNSVELHGQTRTSIDKMSRKIRQSTQVTSFSPTSLSVIYKGLPVTYTYSSTSKSLEETEDGRVTTLLNNCDHLEFKLYQRNPLTNSFNQFPVLITTNEAKVIQVSWRCSRQILGNKGGSAEMISSKIVLRSK
jgi:hypothetical protein